MKTTVLIPAFFDLWAYTVHHLSETQPLFSQVILRSHLMVWRSGIPRLCSDGARAGPTRTSLAPPHVLGVGHEFGVGHRLPWPLHVHFTAESQVRRRFSARPRQDGCEEHVRVRLHYVHPQPPFREQPLRVSPIPSGRSGQRDPLGCWPRSLVRATWDLRRGSWGAWGVVTCPMHPSLWSPQNLSYYRRSGWLTTRPF